MRGGVHLVCDARRDVRAEAALVDPGVHFVPLSFELVDVGAEVIDFGFERVHFVEMWAEGLVEGLRQEIRCRVMRSVHLRRGHGIVVAGAGRTVAVAIAHSTARTDVVDAIPTTDFRRLRLSRIHRRTRFLPSRIAELRRSIALTAARKVSAVVNGHLLRTRRERDAAVVVIVRSGVGLGVLRRAVIVDVALAITSAATEALEEHDNNQRKRRREGELEVKSGSAIMPRKPGLSPLIRNSCPIMKVSGELMVARGSASEDDGGAEGVYQRCEWASKL